MLSTANVVSENLFSTAENCSQIRAAASAAFVAFGPMSCVSRATEHPGSTSAIVVGSLV